MIASPTDLRLRLRRNGRVPAPSLGAALSCEKPLTPILRWVGGKQSWVKQLLTFLPKDHKSRKYHEPFLGAGSLFFQLRPPDAVLADANQHLIDTYRFLRDEPNAIARYLNQHQHLNTELYYYAVRDLYNKSRPSAAQAARFIYLNKTCFNGIFRVNTRGEFNVPYGWKQPPALPLLAELQSVSECLKNAHLRACSFEKALMEVKSGDFVYLDPPYPPLNGTAYFTHYTSGRFSDAAQKHLFLGFKALDRIGAKVMMTNADTKLIRDLYHEYRIRRVLVHRYVTCKSIRHRVRELVVTNY